MHQMDGSKSSFGIKSVGKTTARLTSGEGDVLSSTSTGKGVAAKSTLPGNGSVGIDLQPEEIAFGTLAADTAPITNDFGIDDDDYDLDHPTEGFASIPDAIGDIRQGKIVVVVDDEDRENEGDLIMAAQLATHEAMAFIVKHGTGIVCVSMLGEDLDRLQLPSMVRQNENVEKLLTALTGTVILRDLGVQTMKLMTNNPAKYMGLKGYGLTATGRVPLLTPITKDNNRYLETKRTKMGHIYGTEFNSHLSNLVSDNGNGTSS